jgi:hypothetical protein
VLEQEQQQARDEIAPAADRSIELKPFQHHTECTLNVDPLLRR